MSVPVRPVSPEALDEARRLYELTRVPVQQVADMLGISKSTLNTRIKLWGWTRRIGRIPRAADEGAAPDVPASRGELIARLVRRIEAEIAAIERRVLLAGLGPAQQPEASHADGERAARTLAILVRALRELAALEKQEPDGSDDDASRDADTFRRELGRTLERMLAGGETA
ncbi:hypothetical protein [Ancylobacter vacuolatus]|uniref:Uncharacterized protein n=1 Tax=Ancylobacter vacuolatus TaxID=223389 RepID=A0ABU0DFK5_9HYPH|nr:hypothetical protein [Ancylobacter vacuolatus]MDQ0347208.1 hypothetical protein [Ancylobacter vacuolatus]